MPSIFSKIIAGEVPSHKVYEDDRFLAFMELFPLKPGHTLVIPKTETDYIFDLDDKSLSDLTLTAKKVAVAIKKSVSCEKVAMLVYGLQVRHAHIHLVPVDGTAGELNFANQKKASDTDLATIATKIRSHL